MTAADLPLRLPLGIASFESLRQANFVYVDQTRFIALLENRGIRCAVLRRPPRFGKTLFCNTLTAYYDLEAAGRFDANFSGTFILNHPTKYRSHLFVLRFNFAATNPLNVQTSFCRLMHNGFTDFFHRYPMKGAEAFLKENHTSPSEYFNAFCNFTQSTVMGKLCLIIDDYDGPTRNALRDAPETLIDADKAGGWFQCFYSAVKNRSDEGFLHLIFITGILPVPLSSFSDDFSIATDLSQRPDFAELAGFSHEEVADLVARVLRHSRCRRTPTQLLQQLEDYCGGYCFSPYARTTVFDPSQCLCYLTAFCEYGQAPYPLISPA